MSYQPSRSPRRLKCLLETATYIALTIILFRFVFPILISAKSDVLVIVGFFGIAMWVLVFVGLIIHVAYPRISGK